MGVFCLDIYKENLKELGLTKWEIDLYLTLLKIGDAKKKDITRQSAIPPSKIYEVANKLINKGLLSSLKINGVTRFSVASPNRIVQLLEDKQNRIGRQARELSETISKNRLVESFKASEVFIYKGQKGIINAINNLLSNLHDGGTVYVLADYPEDLISKEKTRFKNLINKMNERKIQLKCLINEEWRKKYNKKINNNHEVRYLPNQVKSPCFICSWKDIVAISIIMEDPLTILIRNKQAVDSFMSHFKTLWGTAKK